MIEMKIKKPSEAHVERRHRELWDQAIADYGQATSVPRDVARDIDEEIRALYVLALAWDGAGSPHSTLRTYGVLPNVIERLAGESDETAKQEKRKDKYAKLISLAKSNVFKEFTVAQLVEESGLSNSTIISWSRATGYFRSSGERGLWEARNPAEDRRADE